MTLTVEFTCISTFKYCVTKSDCSKTDGSSVYELLTKAVQKVCAKRLLVGSIYCQLLHYFNIFSIHSFLLIHSSVSLSNLKIKSKLYNLPLCVRNLQQQGMRMAA